MQDKKTKKKTPGALLTIRRVRTGVSAGLADHNEITSDKYPPPPPPPQNPPQNPPPKKLF